MINSTRRLRREYLFVSYAKSMDERHTGERGFFLPWVRKSGLNVEKT
jgi:hypothetical protein